MFYALNTQTQELTAQLVIQQDGDVVVTTSWDGEDAELKAQAFCDELNNVYNTANNTDIDLYVVVECEAVTALARTDSFAYATQ